METYEICKRSAFLLNKFGCLYWTKKNCCIHNISFFHFRRLQIAFDLSDNHRGPYRRLLLTGRLKKKRINSKKKLKTVFFKNKYRFTNVEYKLKG